MAFHDITTLAYIVHVGAGTLGLVSGMVAAFARKGGRLHRTAGNFFFASMTVMAAFAAYLGIVVPDHINIFIATFTAYLVATAWLTVRRKEGTIGLAEKITLAVAIVLCAPFAILAFQLAACRLCSPAPSRSRGPFSSRSMSSPLCSRSQR
jgi:hypothetical protein